MEYAVAVLAIGAVNLLCFVAGAKVGQTVSRGGTVELPELNPVKAVRAHTEAQKWSAEERRMEAILRNIDNYDGTGNGQVDIPR